MINLIPIQYRLLAGAFAVALAAMAMFAWGWSSGGARVQAQWDRAALAQQADRLAAEQAARATEQAMQQQLQEAEHAAAEREKKLRADYAAAHAAARGLRDTISALRNELPDAAGTASRATAGTALALLGECADQYRAVAEAADGHASDVQTLTAAWPKPKGGTP